MIFEEHPGGGEQTTMFTARDYRVNTSYHTSVSKHHEALTDALCTMGRRFGESEDRGKHINHHENSEGR